MIDGVAVTPLKRIGDARGQVMHMLRGDSPRFHGFGEIYFSTVNPGAVKGWHRHKRTVNNYAVPSGCAKFVLYDDRDGSPTRGAVQEVKLGGDDYALLTVPPMVWYAFAADGDGAALIANCASLPHDPAEGERRDIADSRIPYDWNAADT